MSRFLLCFAFLYGHALSAQFFMPPALSGSNLGLAGAQVGIPDVQFGMSGAAQLGWMEQKHIAYVSSALPYAIPDWQSVDGNYAYRLSKVDGVGLSLSSQRVPGYAENAFAVHYARRLMPKFSAGISLGYHTANAQEYGKAGAPLYRIHLQQKLTPQFTIGTAFGNILQSKTAGQTRRSDFQLGVSWEPNPLFRVSCDASLEAQREAVYRLGMSYLASPRFMLLAGVQSSDYERVTFGFGFAAFKQLRIDVTGGWHPILGVTPSLGLFFKSE